MLTYFSQTLVYEQYTCNSHLLIDAFERHDSRGVYIIVEISYMMQSATVYPAPGVRQCSSLMSCSNFFMLIVPRWFRCDISSVYSVYLSVEFVTFILSGC